MWNPWGTLRTMRHVVIEWQRPHPYAPAATDGRSKVWIDPRANQVERRCFLAHELVHLERQHTGCQPPAVERAVRQETATRLVPLHSLLKNLRWASAMQELADELAVTEMVLRDRLRGLTPAERERIVITHAAHPLAIQRWS